MAKKQKKKLPKVTLTIRDISRLSANEYTEIKKWLHDTIVEVFVHGSKSKRFTARYW